MLDGLQVAGPIVVKKGPKGVGVQPADLFAAAYMRMRSPNAEWVSLDTV